MSDTKPLTCFRCIVKSAHGNECIVLNIIQYSQVSISVWDRSPSVIGLRIVLGHRFGRERWEEVVSAGHNTTEHGPSKYWSNFLV